MVESLVREEKRKKKKKKEEEEKEKERSNCIPTSCQPHKVISGRERRRSRAIIGKSWKDSRRVGSWGGGVETRKEIGNEKEEEKEEKHYRERRRGKIILPMCLPYTISVNPNLET